MEAGESRIRFIEHQGRRILLQDYSRMGSGMDFLREVEKARRMIAAEPYRSVLTVVNATGSTLDTGVLQTFREFMKVNTPYIRKTAVVGVTDFQGTGLPAMGLELGRPLHACGTIAEALDLLAGAE
jgi:hypothetical protein